MSGEFNIKIVFFKVFCVLIVTLFLVYGLYISKDGYHKEKYSNPTALGVHNLINLHYTNSNTGSLLYPERVIGGSKLWS